MVLQPMNGTDKLRRFLYAGGFYIEKEEAVSERGHMYTVISAYYGGKAQQVTDMFALCGAHLNQQEDSHSQAYLEHQKEKIKKILMQLKNAAPRFSNQEKRQYLEGLYSQLLQISHKEA